MARSSDHLDGLPGDAERRLERLFVAFDDAWKKGMRPRISAHLPSGSPQERRAALVELALIDLEYALGRDPSARIEAYLIEFPELAADRDLVLELADREYLLRRERGAAPSVKEYVGRFPDLAARLVFRLDAEATPTPRSAARRADETDLYQHRSPVTDNPLITPLDETVPASLPDNGVPRYINIRPHAKGGLGEVFTADDSTLNRKVALKRIRPDLAGNETVRLRFFREAEITAKIEHKGIAPIHELITDRLGQPWYVMRFVRGHTLRSSIERHHKSKGNLAARHLEFRALLGRFIAICETMAYAHRLGIVHRDLKPANVILGDYGETIVLDWGLATASGETDSLYDHGSFTPGASPLDASLMKSGKLIGTPGFMSPEQAAGHQSAVGPCSDIYALGAILFMILTGRPPFAEPDVPKLLLKIQAGEFSKPREVRSEVPAALEAVCVKAMSLKAENRYEDSLSLGRDMERWLAGEPVSVYREPRAEQFGRWARQHKKRLALAAVAAIVLVAGLASYAVATWKRRWAAEGEANQLLARADEIAVKAEKNADLLNDAISKTEQARTTLSEAGVSRVKIQAMDSRLESYKKRQKDQRFLLDLEKARLLGVSIELAPNDKEANFGRREKLAEYKRLFEDYGLDLFQLTSEKTGLLLSRHPLRNTLVATIEDWALGLGENDNQRSDLISIANWADNESRPSRTAMASRNKNDLIEFSKKMDLSKAVALRMSNVGEALREVGALDEAAAFLEDARAQHPEDFWITETLARVYWEMQEPNRQKAATYFAIAESLNKNVRTRVNYANALLVLKGDTKSADQRYTLALKDDPSDPAAHYGLGYSFRLKHDDAKAAGEFLRALQIRTDYQVAHNAYVASSNNAHQISDCINNYKAMIAAKPTPEAYCGLGMAWRAKGDYENARDAFTKAVEQDKDFAPGHYNLGLVRVNQGEIEQAIIEHEEAVRLAADSPLHQQGLGEAYRLWRKLEKAEHALREAIKLKQDFWQAHWTLGLCLRDQGRFDKALEELMEGNKLGSKQNPDWQEEKYLAKIDEVREYLAFQPRIPAFVNGSDKPKNSLESFRIASVCYNQSLFDAATKFWLAALDEDEQLLGRLEGVDLKHVKAAALSGTGHAKDNPAPDEEIRERRLSQSLEWLKDYLDLLQDQPTRRDVVKCLNTWKGDPDLHWVRDAAELNKLSEKQRSAWSEFWKRVDEVGHLGP
jgi:serine/threonine protein kinase/Tfp pilus assembly protein PilF